MTAEPQRPSDGRHPIWGLVTFVAVAFLVVALASACKHDSDDSNKPTTTPTTRPTTTTAKPTTTTTAKPTPTTTAPPITTVSRQNSCQSWREATAACKRWQNQRRTATPVLDEDGSGTTTTHMTQEAGERSSFKSKPADDMRKALGIRPRDTLTRGQFAQIMCAGIRGSARGCGQDAAIQLLKDRKLTTEVDDFRGGETMSNAQLVVFTDRLIKDQVAEGHTRTASAIRASAQASSPPRRPPSHPPTCRQPTPRRPTSAPTDGRARPRTATSSYSSLWTTPRL